MLFAKFVTETNKQLLPCGSCKYEFENFRHTGPLQSDWSKSVLAPPLSIPKCLPFFHAKSMSLAILSLYYRWYSFRIIFTGRSAEAGLELTLSLSHSVSKRQMGLLMASNAKSAQSKDV